MKKKTKDLLKAVAIGTATAATTYFLIGNVFYYIALTKNGLTSSLSQKIMGGSKPKDEYKKYLDGKLDEGKIWFDNAKKEKLVIRSSDNKKNLHADFLFPEKESEVYVLVIHGYTSSPRNMGVYAQKYNELGYNVIMPSLNGHADSEKDFVTMGWKDRLDVIDWINYITESAPDSKIIIHGVSMGAATTMMTTGEELPNNVKFAVADCGYTSVWDVFSNKLKSAANVPPFPLLYGASTVNKIYSGFSFKEASSVEQLKKSKIPTLFIHGDKDGLVPYDMLDIVYESAACEKDRITIEGAPHARNSCANPELYWSAVEKFIEKYI